MKNFLLVVDFKNGMSITRLTKKHRLMRFQAEEIIRQWMKKNLRYKTVPHERGRNEQLLHGS